ncbi:MAG: hypothetical protein JWQ01_4396 [Massilia sp.]|jgi:hypothetical protein|nr:hypothetical protein [Massilia sp.]
MQHYVHVSSILLQENRFSPLLAAGFFLSLALKQDEGIDMGALKRLQCDNERLNARHRMRRALPSLFRFVACFLVISIMTSGFAMAAYVCPQLARAPAMTMDEGVACAEMDEEKPVHCAVFRSGSDLALEHVAVAPALAPVVAAFIWPAAAVVVPAVPADAWYQTLPSGGADPPYSRTQRLRI